MEMAITRTTLIGSIFFPAHPIYSKYLNEHFPFQSPTMTIKKDQIKATIKKIIKKY